MAFSPTNGKLRSNDDKPPDDGAAIKSGDTHIKHSIETLIPPMIKAACDIDDVEKGRQALTEMIPSSFLAKFSGAMKRLDRELADLEVELAATCKLLKEAYELDAITPRNLHASAINRAGKGDEPQEINWSTWGMRHRIESLVLAVALPIALGASAYSAWANLTGTNISIFIDNPILPISMSLLAPMASLTFKSMWHSMFGEQSKRTFTRGLNVVTGMLIVSWAILFAHIYDGLSPGDLGGDLFAEEDALDGLMQTAFTTVTLMTEMAIGVVITKRLTDISEAYAADTRYRNPDSELIEERIIDLEMRKGWQGKAVLELIEEQESYPHSLDLQMNTALLSYDARRARNDSDAF